MPLGFLRSSSFLIKTTFRIESNPSITTSNLSVRSPLIVAVERHEKRIENERANL